VGRVVERGVEGVAERVVADSPFVVVVDRTVERAVGDDFGNATVDPVVLRCVVKRVDESVAGRIVVERVDEVVSDSDDFVVGRATVD